jgi:D-amino peptidase
MVPGATYITGKPRPGIANLSRLDDSFAGMVMLGFHAMNGTEDGVLHHTQSSMAEKKYWYNGVECGELVQNAAIAGHFGVPLIMVTGDEATCREARRFFGDEIITVATKKGLAREAAELYPFERTRQALYEGAKRAMSVISECKPYVMETPIKGKLQYLQFDSDTGKSEIIVKEKTFENVLEILDF